MDQPESLQEKLAYWRANGLNIAPSATPSRKNQNPPAEANPAWEKGIVTESRPDGSRMPLLDKDLNPIGVKSYAENRAKIDEARSRLRSSTTQKG